MVIINFGKDFHPEFEGYIGTEDTGVWISFIVSKEKGKGNFSRFLEELKQKYDWIKIPTPFGLMKLIALKEGFILKEEFFPEPFNEMGEILYWEKKKEWKKIGNIKIVGDSLNKNPKDKPFTITKIIKVD